MADKTKAQIGSKTKASFWKPTASPPAYTDIGKVRRASGIGVELPEVESSTWDDEAEAFIPGLKRGKTVTIVMPDNAANRAIAETYFQEGALLDMKIEWPAPMSLTRYFPLQCLGYELGEITPGGLLEITMTGRMTSSPPSATDPHAAP
jgi:hypothetical protein